MEAKRRNLILPELPLSTTLVVDTHSEKCYRTTVEERFSSVQGDQNDTIQRLLVPVHILIVLGLPVYPNRSLSKDTSDHRPFFGRLCFVQNRYRQMALRYTPSTIYSEYLVLESYPGPLCPLEIRQNHVSSTCN